MNRLVHISDAASLAFHATGYLATSGSRVAVSTLAERFEVSPAHLSKVLQRLTRAGLVGSKAGPGGGFYLLRPARDVRLLDVYEAIEGPLPTTTCLLGHETCPKGPCVMGGVLEQVNQMVRDHLSFTTLADVTRLPSFADVRLHDPGVPHERH